MDSDSKKLPLKILCIHGYRQNGSTFRGKMGAFRKFVKSQTELVFVDAPHIIPLTHDEQKDNEVSHGEQLGWWFSQENCTFKAQEVSDVCKGFEESVEAVEKVLQQQGPFDGLLGFSQGAAFVALLCSLKQAKELKGDFSFAIVFAGFKSGSLPHERLYHSPIEIPSLHIYGKTDAVIPIDMSEDLAACFVKPTCCVHDGGHFINMSGPQKNQYKTFLLEMISLKHKQV